MPGTKREPPLSYPQLPFPMHKPLHEVRTHSNPRKLVSPVSFLQHLSGTISVEFHNHAVEAALVLVAQWMRRWWEVSKLSPQSCYWKSWLEANLPDSAIFSMNFPECATSKEEDSDLNPRTSNAGFLSYRSHTSSASKEPKPRYTGNQSLSPHLIQSLTSQSPWWPWGRCRNRLSEYTSWAKGPC